MLTALRRRTAHLTPAEVVAGVAAVAIVTLVVALTTKIGPVVWVISGAHGLGVHVGDLAAMALSAAGVGVVGLTQPAPVATPAPAPVATAAR